MDIERKRGDTYPDTLTISNRKTKALTNLTGSTFKMTLHSVFAPTDDTTKVYSIVGVVENPETGVVTFEPSDEQADNLGLFFYEVQMTDSYGKKTTLVQGNYTYVENRTKS